MKKCENRGPDDQVSDEQQPPEKTSQPKRPKSRGNKKVIKQETEDADPLDTVENHSQDKHLEALYQDNIVHSQNSVLRDQCEAMVRHNDHLRSENSELGRKYARAVAVVGKLYAERQDNAQGICMAEKQSIPSDVKKPAVSHDDNDGDDDDEDNGGKATSQQGQIYRTDIQERLVLARRHLSDAVSRLTQQSKLINSLVLRDRWQSNRILQLEEQIRSLAKQNEKFGRDNRTFKNYFDRLVKVYRLFSVAQSDSPRSASGSPTPRSWRRPGDEGTTCEAFSQPTYELENMYNQGGALQPRMAAGPAVHAEPGDDLGSDEAQYAAVAYKEDETTVSTDRIAADDKDAALVETLKRALDEEKARSRQLAESRPETERQLVEWKNEVKRNEAEIKRLQTTISAIKKEKESIENNLEGEILERKRLEQDLHEETAKGEDVMEQLWELKAENQRMKTARESQANLLDEEDEEMTTVRRVFKILVQRAIETRSNRQPDDTPVEGS